MQLSFGMCAVTTWHDVPNNTLPSGGTKLFSRSGDFQVKFQPKQPKWCLRSRLQTWGGFQLNARTTLISLIFVCAYILVRPSFAYLRICVFASYSVTAVICVFAYILVIPSRPSFAYLRICVFASYSVTAVICVFAYLRIAYLLVIPSRPSW